VTLSKSAKFRRWRPRETLSLPNVVSSTFGRSNSTGSIVLVPARGASLAMSARLYSPRGSGTIGTAVPVVAAASGLRRGQFDVFSGIEESTNAAATLSFPGTSRTRFGIVETSGVSVKVRATIVLSEGASRVSTVVSRDFSMGPRELLYIDSLSDAMFGPSRDEAFGALHNLQIRFELVEGSGAARVFVLNVDNQSGDEILRLE